MPVKRCQSCGTRCYEKSGEVISRRLGVTRKFTYHCPTCGADGYTKNNSRCGLLAKNGEYFGK